MDDRILLEHLIARVEPRIRDVSRRPLSHSMLCPRPLNSTRSRCPAFCPCYRTGNELAQVHSRKMTATAGGQARSATRIRERDARKPYVEEYWRLRGEGKSAPMARAAAMKLLEADVKSGKRFPGLKGLLPDARTARKWFPSK
jgi:hypothetical protein